MTVSDVSFVESENTNYTAGVGIAGTESWVSGIYLDCCGVDGEGGE